MVQIQDKITRAKRELEQMIDLNPQVLLLVDRDGRISRANKALLSLLGFSGYPEVLGKRFADIFPGTESVMGMLIRRDGCREMEADVALAGGRGHTLHFTVVGVGQESELAAVIVSDVSDEKAEAASLAISHKKEAVRALAGALMHNVNQSLTVIMVNAQLMNLMLEKGAMDPEDVANSLRDIVRETSGIADVLKNVSHPIAFVTEPYPGAEEILDIKRSTGGDEGIIRSAPPTGYVWPESSFTSTVEMLITLLAAHEHGAERHARMVASYASVLSGTIGHSGQDAAVIRNCALLHDVGKLGLPDAILGRSSPLSRDEQDVARKHTGMGYRLLQGFPMAYEASEVALSHHERWDGKGYPNGLAGNGVHPVARIVSVADAIDVLLNGAVRKFGSPDAVSAEINAGSGTQFDPDVVKAFNACWKELAALPQPAPG
ncbi:MAG: HD domain-containing phosphohydrolase [bacterium]